MLKAKRSLIDNQKGMAVFEMLPMLVIFVILTSFMMGFFGVIHTSILQSISSRNYAFETFRGRSTLTYFRENRPAERQNRDVHFKVTQLRLHATVSEKSNAPNRFVAASRTIDLWNRAEKQGNTPTNHSDNVQKVAFGKRWQEQGANPVWVRVSYGICMNKQCGDL